MTATAQRRGVYPSATGWSWFDPATQEQGAEFPGRDAARAAYAAFKAATPATTKAATPATAKVTPASTKRSRKPKVVATKAEAATRQWTAGASAKAWSIFSKQPNAKRRDALALCVKAGINLNTAKTQYQHWLHRKEAK